MWSSTMLVMGCRVPLRSWKTSISGRRWKWTSLGWWLSQRRLWRLWGSRSLLEVWCSRFRVSLGKEGKLFRKDPGRPWELTKDRVANLSIYCASKWVGNLPWLVIQGSRLIWRCPLGGGRLHWMRGTRSEARVEDQVPTGWTGRIQVCASFHLLVHGLFYWSAHQDWLVWTISGLRRAPSPSLRPPWSEGKGGRSRLQASWRYNQRCEGHVRFGGNGWSAVENSHRFRRLPGMFTMATRDPFLPRANACVI